MANLDFTKLPANKHITVLLGPEGSIKNPGAPTAAELNAMLNSSVSISWNDYDFGVQASETQSDPSLADAANFEDFGAANFGGSMSFYYPKDYDDNSNTHSQVYDLTDRPHERVDVAVRIDGDTKTTEPFEDGQFVSCFSTIIDGESNQITGAEAMRRTVTFLQNGDFSHYTIVGTHELTVPASPVTVKAGEAIRVPVKVQGRDYTNALSFKSKTPTIVDAHKGGIIVGLKTGSGTVIVEDEDAGTSKEIQVTVS